MWNQKLCINFNFSSFSSQNIAVYEWLPGYLNESLSPYPGKNHPECVCAYRRRGTGNAPLPTSCGELSYRWRCLTNMCSVSKTSPWASFLCWISTRSWGKLKALWSDEPISSPTLHFHGCTASLWSLKRRCRMPACTYEDSHSIISFNVLTLLRLPAVCGSRDLSWVPGGCHEIWHHYGPTWCLHEVSFFIFFPR